MNNSDPFSPKEGLRSSLGGIRSTPEVVVADPFTRALISGESQVREARARVYPKLGDISCRDCPLFNTNVDPYAWARNAQNMPAHIVREYTAQYLKRLEAAEKGLCHGLIKYTEELVVDQISVVVGQEDDPSLRGQVVGESTVERCGLDQQGPRPIFSN